MYVCICKSLNEKELKRVVESGCSTARQVCQETGAGSQCGKCKKDIVNELRKLTNG